VLLIALFIPLYKAEIVLGNILGAAFTFGPVIPFIGIIIFSTVSALSNLGVKPLLVKLWSYFRQIQSK